MFRQSAVRLKRATPTRQPSAYQGNIVFTKSANGVVGSSSRVFSTSPCKAINRGFWTAEGKRKNSTATLFKKAGEHRIQQEQRSQEEARKRELEAGTRRSDSLHQMFTKGENDNARARKEGANETTEFIAADMLVD
ncbi:hypothetical protein E8E12_011120 [Didymella heteroderae]|uniref:Uncharacterized protein n=1 Tax=Didymella heteroderae TaxID=1769908 RepID=A0A9P4X0Q5_9PLEO|nr:hypothetical protein E8E12_011120 [Didymella heteroderae]